MGSSERSKRDFVPCLTLASRRNSLGLQTHCNLCSIYIPVMCPCQFLQNHQPLEGRSSPKYRMVLPHDHWFSHICKGSISKQGHMLWSLVDMDFGRQNFSPLQKARKIKDWSHWGPYLTPVFLSGCMANQELWVRARGLNEGNKKLGSSKKRKMAKRKFGGIQNTN